MMMTVYPRFNDFVKKFSLSNLREWATAPSLGGMTGADYCQFSTTAPTLGMVSDAYGVDSVAGWLASHLNQFLITSAVNPDRKPSTETLMQVGRSWLTEWPQLKVTELWVFFNEVLAGRYGQLVYGGVEMSSLGAFLAKHMECRLSRQARLDAARRAEVERKEREEFEREKQAAYDKFHSPEFLSLPLDKQESLRRFVSIYYRE